MPPLPVFDQAEYETPPVELEARQPDDGFTNVTVAADAGNAVMARTAIDAAQDVLTKRADRFICIHSPEINATSGAFDVTQSDRIERFF